MGYQLKKGVSMVRSRMSSLSWRCAAVVAVLSFVAVGFGQNALGPGVRSSVPLARTSSYLEQSVQSPAQWIYFRPVVCPLGPVSPGASSSHPVSPATCAAPALRQPDTIPDHDGPHDFVVISSSDGSSRYVLGPAAARRPEFSSATVVHDGTGCAVRLTVTKAALALLDHRGGHPVSLMAVDVDGQVPAVITDTEAASLGDLRLPPVGSISCGEASLVVHAASTP
jgi:hypothetical protein